MTIIEDLVINDSALLIQLIGCNNITILDIHFVGSVLAIVWPEYYISKLIVVHTKCSNY